MKLPIPIKDKVLVKGELIEESSLGGIIVPESFRGRSATGRVVAVGKGTSKKPMKIPVGVMAFYIKDAGDEIILPDGEKYYLMLDRDILGYLEN